jgi:2-methylcitrate dehydratase PrpD
MARELSDGLAGSSSAAIAHFVAHTRWEDVPAQVQHEARRSLVNFFATSLAGCRDPALNVAHRVFARFNSAQAGGPQPPCTVIGRSGTADAMHAASLNAMSGNVFDFDDTHLPTIIHPTAPVAPALLALAETRPLNGRDLLLAFVLGVEVECRLGNAVSPGHYQRGWHITSTCGVFGAAAACARALGLDSTAVRWSLGHAAAQSGGLVENLGSMAKSIGVGNAASNGLLSALLAAEGFEGPQAPLEGPRGFVHVTAEQPDLSALTIALGERWELLNNTYKPYPCGVVLNPVIEACMALHAQRPVPLADIARVELRGPPLLRQRTDRAAPHSGREAQVSAQHAVAVVLADGKAGLDEFSDARAAAGEARALAARLHFVDDPTLGVESATVTVHLRDQRVLSHHVAAARGSLALPLSDSELESKLVDLAAWGGSHCAPQPLIDALWSLHDRADAGSLMLLARAAANP